MNAFIDICAKSMNVGNCVTRDDISRKTGVIGIHPLWPINVKTSSKHIKTFF